MITITVSSDSIGEGKTSLAIALMNALNEAGFSINLTDDTCELSVIERSSFQTLNSLSQYIKGVPKMNIIVDNVQPPRAEGYPDDWAKVTLMVSPEGEIHAIGGDREQGEGDTAYIGLERIKDNWRR